MFGKNKKTSFSGLAMLLAGVADIMHGISTDASMINWQADIIAISGGVGLLLAKDGNVTGGTVLQPSSAPVIIAKKDEEQQKVG